MIANVFKWRRFFFRLHPHNLLPVPKFLSRTSNFKSSTKRFIMCHVLISQLSWYKNPSPLPGEHNLLLTFDFKIADLITALRNRGIKILRLRHRKKSIMNRMPPKPKAKRPFSCDIDLAEIEMEADPEYGCWWTDDDDNADIHKGLSYPEAAFETETEHQGGPGTGSEKEIPNAVLGERYVNFKLAPDEYLLQCPYEISHRILPMRMANHLYRCRKNYAKKLAAHNQVPRMVACHWNPYHSVSEIELQYHSAQCADRLKSKEEARSHLKYAPKLRVYKELEQNDEDWGKEPQRYLSYNPRKKLEEEPIFYQPKMMSKAEKKAYREEQRHKFYRLVTGDFWESFHNPRLDEFYEKQRTESAVTSGSQTNLASPPGSAYGFKEVDDGPAILVRSFTQFGLHPADDPKVKSEGKDVLATILEMGLESGTGEEKFRRFK